MMLLTIIPFTTGCLLISGKIGHVETFGLTPRQSTFRQKQKFPCTSRIYANNDDKTAPPSAQITEGLTGEEAAAIRERRIKEADAVAMSLGIKEVLSPDEFDSTANGDDNIAALVFTSSNNDFDNSSNEKSERRNEFRPREEIDDVVVHDAEKQQRESLTIPQRLRVLAFRTALITSALLLATAAIYSSNFLAGTGIDVTYIVESTENVLLPIAAAISLLLAPFPEGIAAPMVALGLATTATAVVGSANDTLISASRDLGVISLLSLSVREIYYFGLAYKLEAVIASLLLPILLVGGENNEGPLRSIATPLSALAVGVLAIAKVFEPCEEDYFKSNSEFLADGKPKKK